MAHTIDYLRSEIEKLRQKSPDGRYFVSPYDLKALFTRDIIAETILECAVPDYQQSNIVNRIFTDGQIVFGILIWKKWHHKLMSFVEHNALDTQLPLDISQAQKVAETFGWDFAQNAQWEFLPRILRKEMSGYHCHFRDEEILPFTSETWLGEGGFGEVFKVSVFPSLQTIFPEPMADVFIVRKRLRMTQKPGGKYLEREKECLRILDHLRHPNIVQLLGSYSHRGDHYFLFPLFRMDLEQFLHLEKRSGDFDKDFMVYAALQGLSSALETVHSLNLNTRDHDMELKRIGYHHDIRPANVLTDSRTFYLADFGLARMKPGDENSQTKWKSGLGDYVAPECIDEKLMHREVGRPLDIWSFGCMMSEIAAYIKGGPDGVKGFREQRLGPGFRPNMTNQYFFFGNSLRLSVISWFEKSKAQSGSAVFRNLLEAANLMLKVNPIERPKAAEVHQLLSFLSVQALFDAVQQAFTRYLIAALESGDTGIQTTQLENSRLAAWGKVLQLTGGGPSVDAIGVISDKGICFRRILLCLLEKLESDAKADETESSSAVTFSIRRPIHEQLQELIEKLWNSLPTRHQGKLRQVWLEDSLVTDSRTHEALYDIESSPQLRQYSELGAFASTKLENERLKDEKEVSKPRKSEGEHLQLNSNALHIEKHFDQGLAIGRYYDDQVFVEWVSHTTKWEEISGPERQQHMQLVAEAFHLSSKPSTFRVLGCLGFVLPSSDLYDYGFVYAFPASTPKPLAEQKATTPKSLFHILTSYNKVELPLGERFRLAHKLVSCVRELHIARWLHKNINSRNVIFFEEERSTSTLTGLLEDPYLINFRNSRPSEKASQTERQVRRSEALQHFQHPDYSAGGQHFREIYDYYSVGIVLLELGSWTTLEVYLGHNPELGSDPSAFRNILINKYAPRLSHLMGKTYTDVTLACLRCDFGQGEVRGSRDVEGQTVLGEFYDKVVGPLGELSRCPI